MNTHTDTIKWYKLPLVWMVIFFPAFAVVGGLSMLAISIYIDDGVVVDDYYKKGKEINRVLIRDQFAHELALKGGVVYSAENNKIHITLASGVGAELSKKVKIAIMHGTRGNMDVNKEIISTQNGLYQLQLKTPLAKGPWIIQLSTDRWRIHGRLNVPNRLSGQLTAQ